MTMNMIMIMMMIMTMNIMMIMMMIMVVMGDFYGEICPIYYSIAKTNYGGVYQEFFLGIYDVYGDDDGEYDAAGSVESLEGIISREWQARAVH